MGMFDVEDEDDKKKTENKKKEKSRDIYSTATTIVFYICVTIVILTYIICSHINDIKNVELEEQQLVYNATYVEENNTVDAE